jgi:Flp pilus assembly protein TadD
MKHAAFSRLSIAFALLFSLWGTAAHANEYDDVNALLRAGKPAEALAKADTYIAGKPRDPQMRFLRGVILTEQNKQAEAITAFTQLTQDFPELSEPYNNLAALYASQSKFDQARAALEQAIKLNRELRHGAREPRRRVCAPRGTGVRARAAVREHQRQRRAQALADPPDLHVEDRSRGGRPARPGPRHPQAGRPQQQVDCHRRHGRPGRRPPHGLRPLTSHPTAH